MERFYIHESSPPPTDTTIEAIQKELQIHIPYTCRERERENEGQTDKANLRHFNRLKEGRNKENQLGSRGIS